MEIFWYLPTQGDERYLGTSRGRREPDLGYLRQITQAVDYLGYSGMLLGTGTKQEGWIVASSLITATERLKFLIAIRPSVMSPSLCARMAATFDQLSKGRILLNLVAGGNTQQLKGDGIFQEHDERYEACDEFAQVWKLLFTGEIVDFKGKYFHIEGARLDFPPVQSPYPPLYFGGSSPAALEVAANHIDVYLTWGEPPHLAAEKIDQVRKLAEAKGRTVRFGIRLHSIVRETEREAWDAANRLIENLDDDRIATTAQNFSKSESVGQKRMTALHGGDRTKLEVSPNLWAGVGLARGGAGTALVGSPENVAARIKEYAEIGIETFIMSGYPSLEEAYLLAELVFPLLPLNNYENPLRKDTVQVLGKSYGGINGQDRVHASG